MQTAEPKIFDGFAAPRDQTPLARSHEAPLPVFAAHAVHVSSEVLAVIVAGIEKAAAFTHRLRARRRQQREAWAAYDALRQLDDHTLRDLGFERSKLMRVVPEVVIARATVRQLEGSL
jgi:uncharacterized protein YjiS (DUF1127 family)